MAGQDFYTDPAQEAVHPEARLPQRPGKRRMRWTDQHTKILILGIVLAALLVGTIIYAIAKQKKPDYTLGLITSYSMPETGVMQIEDLLGRFADDRNGDGTVRVEVVNYVFSDSETLQGLQKASQQALEQDLAEGTSLLFLHDQEGFQKVAGEFAGLCRTGKATPWGRRPRSWRRPRSPGKRWLPWRSWSPRPRRTTPGRRRTTERSFTPCGCLCGARRGSPPRRPRPITRTARPCWSAWNKTNPW